VNSRHGLGVEKQVVIYPKDYKKLFVSVAIGDGFHPGQG
jgi:hypothetical protein